MNLPRRPLVGLVLCFVVGTGLGLAHPLSPLALLSATALCLAPACAAVFLPRAGSFTIATLFLAAIGIGWLNASLDSTRPHRPTVESAIVLPATGISLIGIVTDEPVCARHTGTNSMWRFPLTVERLRVARTSPWAEVSGNVRVRLTVRGGRLPAYGERWAFSGFLDQATYRQGRLAGQPAGLYFSASGHGAHFLAAGHGNPFVSMCLQWRTWASGLLRRGIGDFPEQCTILSSLLLGYYSQIPRDLYQAFAATGTLHVFAISGSHVVIFAGAVIVMLSACGVTRTRWILFLAPLLIGYTVMTGLQSSAVRACLMALVFWIAPLIGRKADIYTALAVAALIILAVTPSELFDIGFILSFVAVLGLVLFFPIFAAPLRRRFAPDPLKVEPDPLPQRVFRKLWLFFADLLAMSLAAWLVTAPLTAWYFQTFSPIGLLGNLVAVPVASLIIVTGVLSLVCGSCIGALADLFNHANLVLVYLLSVIIRWFAAVPYGWIQVAAPSLGSIAAFYALLAFWRFALWTSPTPRQNATSDAGESTQTG
jgi:competence protein ComEC